MSNLEEYEHKVQEAVHEYLVAAGAGDESQVIACMMISLRLSSPFESSEQYRSTLIGGTHAEAVGLAGYAAGYHTMQMGGPA
ncbi:hypothetical protein SEA_HOTOROBO_73 [Gordonia phage Hotorobo]|uniref:Uncharacterized protein n=1 Tax=Gordonia phage Hotorobo TaxID=1821554 RepID=A0A142K8D2_9CAUD|nr:hypothetical protein BJD64_gp060 [Gordonia phage Hotorobo]AMS02365.1 hypothetical protein SEA_HOTOROBO_73 [Gordonia phage Hotorobo]